MQAVGAGDRADPLQPGVHLKAATYLACVRIPGRMQVYVAGGCVDTLRYTAELSLRLCKPQRPIV